MAGDPHLHLTLPAIWFQLAMDSPGFHTSGVGIPGTPGVLIGYNQHISWSLTDAQNQQTFYYLEKEDAAHPGQYLWNGLWRKYKTVGYDIPVHGGPTEHLTVKLSVHGPVITERGQTTSVWWAGNIPSQDLEVLMGINQAADYQAFRNALKGWYSPTHNFVYADDKGNIGLISAGYYPQVAAGSRGCRWPAPVRTTSSAPSRSITSRRPTTRRVASSGRPTSARSHPTTPTTSALRRTSSTLDTGRTRSAAC
jgi:penicillin amidase